MQPVRHHSATATHYYCQALAYLHLYSCIRILHKTPRSSRRHTIHRLKLGHFACCPFYGQRRDDRYHGEPHALQQSLHQRIARVSGLSPLRSHSSSCKPGSGDDSRPPRLRYPPRFVLSLATRVSTLIHHMSLKTIAAHLSWTGKLKLRLCVAATSGPQRARRPEVGPSLWSLKCWARNVGLGCAEPRSLDCQVRNPTRVEQRSGDCCGLKNHNLLVACCQVFHIYHFFDQQARAWY